MKKMTPQLKARILGLVFVTIIMFVMTAGMNKAFGFDANRSKTTMALYAIIWITVHFAFLFFILRLAKNSPE